MEGRELLQYIIDTSDTTLAKKQEATEYLSRLESAAHTNASENLAVYERGRINGPTRTDLSDKCYSENLHL